VERQTKNAKVTGPSRPQRTKKKTFGKDSELAQKKKKINKGEWAQT